MLFLGVCRCLGHTFPVTQSWSTAGNVVAAPHSAGALMGDVYSLGVCTALGNPLPGATSAWSHTLWDSSWAFQIIFTSSCVLYQLQHSKMTHSEPDDFADLGQLNGDLFLMAVLSGFSWQAK